MEKGTFHDSWGDLPEVSNRTRVSSLYKGDRMIVVTIERPSH